MYSAEGKTLDEIIEEVHIALYKLCVKNCKRREGKPSDAIWWNSELEVKRSRVRALRRRFQRTYQEEERLFRKIKFKKEMAEFTQSIATAKTNSFRSFLKGVLKVNSFRTFYSLVKDSIRNFGHLCPIKQQDGSFSTSFKESMQIILEYHFPRDCSNILRRQVDLEYNFPLVSVFEIGKIFGEMDLSKAPGLDGLCADIIFEYFNINKKIFTALINQCINTATFPDSWKRASVALIPKEGKDLSCSSSYRPICLLSTWGKILDKILSRRLVYELEKDGKLHENQFGFRNGRSTLNALQGLKDFICNSKINDQVSIAISLDMSNAFNSVEWRDVICALQEDKVSEYLILSIQDFLNNRKIVENNLEIDYNYGKGVPQGSCLGPILWLVIADRLLRAMDKYKNCVVTMFADDILIMASASYRFTNLLEAPIGEIEMWANRFNLKINPDKSKYMVFPFHRKITHFPRLKICNRNIKNVKELKYLGLLFDERLTWMIHLGYFKDGVSALQHKIRRLSRATWGASCTVLKEIYLRAVEKFVLYGSPIWYSENVKLRNKLLQIQRISLLNICKTYKTVSTDALHILSGCPPIHLVARNERLLFDLYVKHGQITIGDSNINYEEVSHFVNIEPPWRVFSFPWEYGNPDVCPVVKIFTDGSKLNNKVGLGIVCFETNGVQKWSYSERISDAASVFIAEAMAILRALEMSKDIEEEIYIYSDSRSVLMAIDSLQDSHYIIFKIKNILKQSDNFKLFWIKAHVGKHGNEVADSLAKKATEKECIDHIVPLPRSWIRFKLKESLIENRQSNWNSSRNARFLFGIFSDVSFNRCLGDFYLNQILTTHGAFPIHQGRFFGKQSLCRCGLDEGTVSHCVYGCPRFHSIRERFFPRNFSVLGFIDLIFDRKACVGLKEIVAVLLRDCLDDC
ncbi:Putative protein in type-1 retrotransposable element R1DM [Araneus ventricosus]|uniref:Retrovirus-related Pol polyprotein from type-1 retrotransposable element R1 n=1 Tax=Araneus ventricosus TaxID=182803 RepID=A0A4Y2STJ4_ARAVE|nr:Putative protein in type-1 retrotransposable element R1DM [Araneus ventricosus]